MRICAVLISLDSCFHAERIYDITTDGSDSFNSKVERLDVPRESRLVEERHDEGSQTAIDVQTDVGSLCELTQRWNGVLSSQLYRPRGTAVFRPYDSSIREIGCRADNHYCIDVPDCLSSDREWADEAHTARAIRLTSACRVC